MSKMDSFSQITWLNSCLQGSLLPSSPWHKIASLICKKLAAVLNPNLAHTEVRQSLYELLGDSFVRHYFQSQPDEPMALELPFMQVQARQEAKAIAEQLLSDAVSSILKDLRSEISSPELQEFHHFCSQLVLSCANEQVERMSGIGGFYQSETIGEALACLLHRQPEQLKVVCKKLIGRLLPNSLRGCVWSLKLEEIVAELSQMAGMESTHYNTRDWQSRKTTFKEVVLRETETGRCTSALTSSISGLIHQSVEQALDGIATVSNLEKDIQWKVLIENVLSCLYTYNKTYEPMYVYLSLPVVVAFFDKKHSEKDELHCIELAWYLSEVISYCLPTTQAISDISADVIKSLQQTDEPLYSHILSITRQASLGLHQEFLSELAAADSTGQASSVLGPEVFIKKWIMEGFVSVLDYYSILFVWDQLFITNWEAIKIQHFCLTIVRILQSKLMATTTFEQLHWVSNSQ